MHPVMPYPKTEPPKTEAPNIDSLHAEPIHTDSPDAGLPYAGPRPDPAWKILGCASKGTNSDDEVRLRALLAHFNASFVPFDRNRKKESFLTCLRMLRAGGFDLFVLEGTGFAAGLAAILGRVLWGRRFVLSSGDSVGPFLTAIVPAGAPLFHLYERALYGLSSGFIGWTPYLVGRALTMGATHAITIAGWAPFSFSAAETDAGRRRIRTALGIPDEAVVFGIAGSISWSKRHQSAYGADLIRAAIRAKTEPYVLIVGDGTGFEILKEMAGERLGKTIFMPGRVPRHEVPHYLAAMDIGSLPQTVDGVGSFRYTTKLSEYRSVRLPLVCNQIPMAYDLDYGDIIRLEGEHPRTQRFLAALAELMDTIRPEDVAALRASIPAPTDALDRERQIRSVTAFLTDLLREPR